MKLKYLLCFLLVIVLSTSSLAVTIPAPSTVTCPTFLDGASGMDTITNSNTNSYGSRNFNYQINGNPNAVIFAWHSLGGFPPDALAIIAPYATNAIIVAPSNGGAQYAWNTGDDVYPNPEDNPDIILFDDILSCLVQTYNVDLDRIWTYGFSAGAMWSSYLGQHRSNDLAAVVAHSGGIQYGGENNIQRADWTYDYTSSTNDIPYLLAWGGTSDIFTEGNDIFSFAEASTRLSAELTQDGSYVTECVDNGDPVNNIDGYGHSIPTNAGEITWRFFEDHPKGVIEPYITGIPTGLSTLVSAWVSGTCTLQSTTTTPPPLVLGDVSGQETGTNNGIDIQDVLLTVNHIIGSTTLSQNAQVAANVACDATVNTINILDVILIIRNMLDSSVGFPNCT